MIQGPWGSQPPKSQETSEDNAASLAQTEADLVAEHQRLVDRRRSLEPLALLEVHELTETLVRAFAHIPGFREAQATLTQDGQSREIRLSLTWPRQGQKEVRTITVQDPHVFQKAVLSLCRLLLDEVKNQHGQGRSQAIDGLLYYVQQATRRARLPGQG